MDVFHFFDFFFHFRIGEIGVEMDDTTVYITTELLEVTGAVDGYFHRNESKTFKPIFPQEFAITEELCARRCLTLRNCGAYSYCGSLDCKLYVDESFYEDFDPDNQKDYDWDKLDPKDDPNCVLGQRFVRYNENFHISNIDYLKKLNEEVKNKAFKFMIMNEKIKEKELVASELDVNIQPGNFV